MSRLILAMKQLGTKDCKTHPRNQASSVFAGLANSDAAARRRFGMEALEASVSYNSILGQGEDMTVRRFSAGTLLVLLFAAAACGGSPATPTQATPPTIYDAGTPGITLPTAIRQVQPQYTAAALAARIQGTVLVGTVVLADGTIGDVTVIRSLDTVYGLDGEAVIAAKQWLFTPATLNGRPVAIRVTIEFTFSLR